MVINIRGCYKVKSFAESIKKLYQSERLTLVLIILNLLASIALFIVGIIKLNPDSAIVKIGYGDIGGYRNGSWADMLTFPMLAIIFGILHNLIALKIYQKRGVGVAKFFLLTTSALIAGAFIVLFRLTGGA
jgi:hypothetical protein